MIRLKGKLILDVIEERDLGIHKVTFCTNDGIYEYKETDISGDLYITFKQIEVLND